MKRNLCSWLVLLLVSLLPATAFCQTKAAVPPGTPVGFVPLLERLAHYRLDRRGNELPWPAPPLLECDTTYGKNRRFELRLADKPLGLQHRVVRLAGRGYPVSYSVVWQGHLVALFKDGKFGCYQLADLAPDEQLARQLDGQGGWERCWLVGGQLVVQKGTRNFHYDPAIAGWQPHMQAVPFDQQPKLYEDARYLVHAECEGEFGGTVYFYDKQTGRTHWANAACANSLWQENGQYYLLVSLGHMNGSAASAIISNPDVLPLVKPLKPVKGLRPNGPFQRKENIDWQYDFTKPERGVTRLFDFVGLQLFGGLRWQGQMLYLTHWNQTTFLATIDGTRITVVDPLFANDLYTHNPVTTTYGPNLALTNLDYYGLGGSDEVTALLWQGQQVTRIEWGKQPDEQ